MHNRAAGLSEGLCELTLETPDPACLAAFYARVFGWRELSRDDDRIWLACGPRSRLGLWSPGDKEFGDRGGRHVHFAVSVRGDRLPDLCDQLERLGVGHRGPVEHEGGDRSVYFRDPEDNVVEAWTFFEGETGEGSSFDNAI